MNAAFAPLFSRDATAGSPLTPRLVGMTMPNNERPTNAGVSVPGLAPF